MVKNEWNTPSASGSLIYFNANPNMNGVLEKVEPEGCKIVLPKTEISPEIGFMAAILDAEGNRVALHSQR